MSVDEISEYLNLTALFRNQWGFRPENGEDDPAFKERVSATLREQLAIAKEESLLVPQVVWVTTPPRQKATTSSSTVMTPARPRSRDSLPAPTRVTLPLHRRLLPFGRER